MEKKFRLMILAIALVVASIVAVIPVEAQPIIRVYVKDPLDSDNTYAARTMGTEFEVEIWVDTPTAWTGTADGIVGYQLSVRFDPRVLGPPALVAQACRKFLAPTGWLEAYSMGKYEVSTVDLTEAVVDGMYYGFAESTLDPIPDGAGGSGKLMRLRFKALRSDAMVSPIAVVKQGFVGTINIGAVFIQADADQIAADTVETGWYIGPPVTDTYFMDVTRWGTSVPGTILHEEWPMWSHEYRIDSHDDTNTNGLMDVSEQIDTFDFNDGSLDWWHVEWVNPTPTPNDGKVDVILKGPKIVPEFPLGLGILMTIAAAIPVAYIWRTRSKRRV